MSNLGYNIIVLVACWVLVAGVGIYVTYFEQPKEVERLRQAEEVARLRQAEVTALLSEEYSSSQAAEEAVKKWRARYKVIPKKLSSPDVVRYLNELTRSGFENFDVTKSGVQRSADVSTYTFRAIGRGYFTSLYKLIWDLENNRNFYRVRDLNLEQIDLLTENKETGNNELKVMVSFSMSIDAYFGGAKGLSATDTEYDGLFEGESLPVAANGSTLPPVPAHVLPDARPDVNPFFPLIMSSMPPNTYDRLDLEQATLVSIVGDEAIFERDGEYYALRRGDDVYLGQITRIDPTDNRVVARLNKGGIIDEVEITLDTGEKYRQALGPVSLAPIESR